MWVVSSDLVITEYISVILIQFIYIHILLRLQTIYIGIEVSFKPRLVHATWNIRRMLHTIVMSTSCLVYDSLQ